MPDGRSKIINQLLANDQMNGMVSPRPDAMPPSVMKGSYFTQLNPLEEMAFQSWVRKNNVPFDPSPTADYDMRGFYSALVNGDPRAVSSINSADHQLHYPDYWKTPYHQTFSRESQFALPNAPTWKGNSLIDLQGNVVFDEDAQQRLRNILK